MLACGDTYLAGDIDYEEFHLWIILTPTDLNEVVVVNVTTRHKRSDTTVIINPGEHPFIKQESVIAYRFAKVKTVAEIEKAISEGTAIRREPISASLLERIRGGLMQSDHAENGVRFLFREFMLKTSGNPFQN